MENKQRILLCEDEESLGMLLREYLQAKGYDAELYLDGEAGYRAFTKGHYDIHLAIIAFIPSETFGFASLILNLPLRLYIFFFPASK